MALKTKFDRRGGIEFTANFNGQDMSKFGQRIKDLAEMLGETEKNNIVGTALASAARVIVDRAIEKAKALDDPTTPNKIYKNIVARKMKSAKSRGYDAGYRIGILGGARQTSFDEELKGQNDGNPGGDTWYWRMLEFGRGVVKVKKARLLANEEKGLVFGKQVQPASPRPFLRPAADESQQEAFNKFAEVVDKKITEVLGI